MISVRNLNKSFGSLHVLKDISFDIHDGSVYGFLGQNGAGKTTTMNILSGLMNFDSGEIYMEGRDLKKSKKELMPQIGYLPQTPAFYNYMTAYEYLDFIGTIANMQRKLIKSRSDELLRTVNLTDSAMRRIGGYSGGMKQRLGIAVCMFNNPKFIILGEPTAALDPEGRLEVLELINSLKKEGITIFLSTHILNDVERICDEVSIINDGRILISEELEKLKSKFIQPIYDVEFEKDCPDLECLLKKVDWIDTIKINKNIASIYIKDMAPAKLELIKIVSDLGLPIITFALRKSTLEDIFIRMVNKDGNI